MRDHDHQEGAAERRRHKRLGTCRALIEERRLVEKSLGVQLCANPNCDMLLHLYEAEPEGFAVYQSALCTVANIPYSSAHRWTATIATRKILMRRLDLRDKRRVTVRLVPPVKEALDRIMDEASTAAIDFVDRCTIDTDSI
ncbi:MarR family transcriptional regulator [Sphingobium lactosutens]|uniref:MarR family transcriptional regulator n=1 Tax=Sphingobium lactosutens TaxID=522773 RepID=UPI0015BF27A1|nr:MarR family transcriptional regulator [Sphingobium lactosutens]NWK95811.1 MarR family transcriptional regulator [Sphingobium lactosutens]